MPPRPRLASPPTLATSALFFVGAVCLGAGYTGGCAAAATTGPTSSAATSGSSSTSWMGMSSSSSAGTGGSGPAASASSASGTGGMGGSGGAAAGTGGLGGGGGAASASSSTSTSSSSSSASSSSGGTTCTSSAMCSAGNVCLSGTCLPPTLLLLAGSSTSLLTGTYEVGGSWSTATLSGTTNSGTSLTVDSNGRGVGVYTDATSALVSATIWSGGAWSAPASINASATAKGQPFVDATGGTVAHLVYQDTSFKYWYLAYTGSWSATPQQVGSLGDPFYGPVPATIAARGADATVAFIDGENPVNTAAETDLVFGVWQARTDPGTLGNFNISPVIVQLNSGPELMMAYVGCGDVGCSTNNAQIMFMTRTGGVWTTPAAIANCLTGDRVALAPLPSGGAILAFRGQDTHLYWSIYSADKWSAVAPFASPNVSVDTTPAVTHGIGGDTAEIAYLIGGVAYHARLSGSAWSAPVTVGGTALSGVAIAAAP